MGNNSLALRIFWVLYNGVLLAGFVLLLPFIAYTVATTAKRRHTFRQRMGWCRSPWFGEAGRDTGQCIWVHALSVGEVLCVRISGSVSQPPLLRVSRQRASYSGSSSASVWPISLMTGSARSVGRYHKSIHTWSY